MRKIEVETLRRAHALGRADVGELERGKGAEAERRLAEAGSPCPHEYYV